MSRQLKMASGEAACLQHPPDPQGSFLLAFDTVNSLDGDRYEVHVKWDDTVELKAAFTADSTSGYWICGLWTGGTWYYDNVELMSGCGTYQYAYLSGRNFHLSYDRAIWRIGGETPSGLHYELWQCKTPPASATTEIVLVHGGGPNTLYWDNFDLSDHYVHDRTCPFEGCVCGATD